MWRSIQKTKQKTIADFERPKVSVQKNISFQKKIVPHKKKLEGEVTTTSPPPYLMRLCHIYSGFGVQGHEQRVAHGGHVRGR